jgi:hypothetical protein
MSCFCRSFYQGHDIVEDTDATIGLPLAVTEDETLDDVLDDQPAIIPLEASTTPDFPLRLKYTKYLPLFKSSKHRNWSKVPLTDAMKQDGFQYEDDEIAAVRRSVRRFERETISFFADVFPLNNQQSSRLDDTTDGDPTRSHLTKDHTTLQSLKQAPQLPTFPAGTPLLTQSTTRLTTDIPEVHSNCQTYTITRRLSHESLVLFDQYQKYLPQFATPPSGKWESFEVMESIEKDGLEINLVDIKRIRGVIQKRERRKHRATVNSGQDIDDPNEVAQERLKRPKMNEETSDAETDALGAADDSDVLLLQAPIVKKI